MFDRLIGLNAFFNIVEREREREKIFLIPKMEFLTPASRRDAPRGYLSEQQPSAELDMTSVCVADGRSAPVGHVPCW